ncbi:hypothetical protein CASFOL_030432 [Castilleja foliolosa]|uniref:Replication factor A C-terminal domain-containing protein n=1 Tax=Castilleja foliolosa TaxID=1961234 RepID=A0ABD3C7X0_9LAMI
MDPLILPVQKVDSLYTVNEESEFWICAIIANFIGNWWYHACSTCDSPMIETGLLFECPICRCLYKDGLLRYKMQIEVIDKSANASILLFDQVAEAFVGISCHDLRFKFIEERKEFQDITDDLERLIDQTFLFRVSVNQHQIHKESSVFCWSMFEADPTLINQHNQFTRERMD